MKNATLIVILVFTTIITRAQSSDLGSKQVLTKSPYQSFYLYAGDELRFEVNGENKKFDIHFGAGYSWSEVFKTKDITTYLLPIKKDGVYTIGWMAGIFKKASEVSLIRVPAQGKENLTTVAPVDKDKITISDFTVFKGETKVAVFTSQTINNTTIYKVNNAFGKYVAVFVVTFPSTMTPLYTNIKIYKAYDVISTATPLKIIENKNYDKISYGQKQAFLWLGTNGYLD